VFSSPSTISFGAAIITFGLGRLIGVAVTG
jgi:hypothetical protein